MGDEVQTAKDPGSMDASNQIPVLQTIGEILDRVSILRLKRANGVGTLSNEQQQVLQNEHERLWGKLQDVVMGGDMFGVEHLYTNYGRLLQVNSQLWLVEDIIRVLLDQGHVYTPEGQQEFLFMARQVPWLNDQRSQLKAEINQAFHGQDHTEVKVYARDMHKEVEDGEEEQSA